MIIHQRYISQYLNIGPKMVRAQCAHDKLQIAVFSTQAECTDRPILEKLLR